ncbi:unnamed protein product [Effrenium voratum]|nr:unnamed protein product [Effrenium voratum]
MPGLETMQEAASFVWEKLKPEAQRSAPKGRSKELEEYLALAQRLCAAGCALLEANEPPALQASLLQDLRALAALEGQEDEASGGGGAVLRVTAKLGFGLKEEEGRAERQLFEFTGLSQDLDQLQAEHRARLQAQRRQRQVARRRQMARKLQELHLALAASFAAYEAAGATEAAIAEAEVLLPKAEDLLDIAGASPVTESPSPSAAFPASEAPASEGVWAMPDLIDVSEPAEIEPEPAEPDSEEPFEDRDVEEQVQRWSQGKSLRALLASLHQLAPEICPERSLAELLDSSALKSAYREALLTFHPDKLPERPMLGRSVVDALIKAQRSER